MYRSRVRLGKVRDAMKGDLSELRPAVAGGLRAWLGRVFGSAKPRARVAASPTARLGARLEVEWRVEPTAGTKLVTVALVGSEIARRRVSARTGISIVTERSDFFVVELDRHVPASDATELRGRGAAEVPAGLVPSHAAKFNDISWSVVVEILSGAAESARQEFPLTVLPGQR
jgi:hypothetical protein